MSRHKGKIRVFLVNDETMIHYLFGIGIARWCEDHGIDPEPHIAEWDTHRPEGASAMLDYLHGTSFPGHRQNNHKD